MTMTTPFAPRNTGSDELGRYYTRDGISKFLVAQMDTNLPIRLLDLGAGNGALSKAAWHRWPNVEIFTVDIDPAVAGTDFKKKNGTSLAKHTHISIDALSCDLPKLLKNSENPIDTAVCNPPFIIPEWKPEFGYILEDVGLSGCIPYISDIDAALLFLAQNLRLLSFYSTLGIILPNSLITSVKYKKFRQLMLEKFTILKIIQLPRGSFHRTDALASIVIIQNCPPTQSNIAIYKLTSENTLTNAVLVPIDQADSRLDYDYHAENFKARIWTKQETLALSEVEINRGNITNAKGKSLPLPFIHTSDLTSDWIGRWISMPDYDISGVPADTLPKNAILAQAGDILLARVGRNLEKKLVGISGGKYLITDCIYRVRAPKKLRPAIFEQLSSVDGQRWLASRAYGIAAKHITKSELANFPISYQQDTN